MTILLGVPAYAVLCGVLGENSEIPMLAIPALPGGEQPVRVLLKSVAKVATPDFQLAARRL
jgi:hypothetical protein